MQKGLGVRVYVWALVAGTWAEWLTVSLRLVVFGHILVIADIYFLRHLSSLLTGRGIRLRPRRRDADGLLLRVVPPDEQLTPAW